MQAKAIKAYAPQDHDLHVIAKNLQELQRRNFYRLSASVKHQGHYYHEMCTQINVENENSYEHYPSEEVENDLSELLRDYMQWIYLRLQSEFDYLTSEEAIKESLIANECQFNEDGTSHH